MPCSLGIAVARLYSIGLPFHACDAAFIFKVDVHRTTFSSPAENALELHSCHAVFFKRKTLLFCLENWWCFKIKRKVLLWLSFYTIDVLNSVAVAPSSTYTERPTSHISVKSSSRLLL